MRVFTGVGQSIVISKTQSKPIGFFVKIFFRNMYRDHGSSVNAYRAVSIEPAWYNGHLRVSVWFFPQLQINRCFCQTCNTCKLEGKFVVRRDLLRVSLEEPWSLSCRIHYFKMNFLLSLEKCVFNNQLHSWRDYSRRVTASHTTNYISGLFLLC